MILLYGAVFLCYFALFILSYRKKKSLVKCSKKSWEKDNRSGIKEGIFGDMANYIYEVLLKGKMLHQKDVNESLFILYPEIGGKEEKKNSYLRQFYIYKIRLWLFIVFAGNILAFCLWIGSRNGYPFTSLTKSNLSLTSSKEAFIPRIVSGKRIDISFAIFFTTASS